NEKTNSPGYFSHSNPPTDYLQSGFTFGGPIQNNRVFFFGDYQHTLDHSDRTTRAIIPPTAFRTGDSSASATKIYDPPTGNPALLPTAARAPERTQPTAPASTTRRLPVPRS